MLESLTVKLDWRYGPRVKMLAQHPPNTVSGELLAGKCPEHHQVLPQNPKPNHQKQRKYLGWTERYRAMQLGWYVNSEGRMKMNKAPELAPFVKEFNALELPLKPKISRRVQMLRIISLDLSGAYFSVLSLDTGLIRITKQIDTLTFLLWWNFYVRFLC